MYSRTIKSIAAAGTLLLSCVFVTQSNASQPVGLSCNLESVSGVNLATKPITLNSKSTRGLIFTGWVAQTGSKSPNPTGVSIGIFSSDGKKSIIDFKASALTLRPDVKKVFNNSAISNVGFNVKSSSSIPSGNYSVKIVSKFANSSASSTCGDWQIQVK